MRKIFINTLCGMGISFALSPATEPTYWIGMVCFCVALANSMID